MPTAPIVLLVYNRVDHSQRTVEALKKNLFASESELYIYADAARDANSVPGVEAVREYLKSITGFKDVQIRLRESNLGVDENTILAVTEIVNEKGRVIVLEDDLETSPWFLKFMNEALEYYEQNERVISVHGYSYPVDQKLKEAFFLKGADCWGWATWKRGWNLFERNGNKLLEELRKKGLEKEFDFGNTYPYTAALERQARGETKEWDIRWYASAFLEDKLTLYPGRSLVRNIGHDASGTHCGTTDVYDVSLNDAAVNVITEVDVDLLAFEAYADFFRRLPQRSGKRRNWLARSFKKLRSAINGF